MTRVNVVPVEELTNIHALAEYKEITRVFTQRRKAIEAGRTIIIPKNYCLGTGHVSFFTDKLQYILDRYQQLAKNLKQRGYNVNPVSYEKLVMGIDSRYFNNYTPTPEAVALNKGRIAERLVAMKRKR